ncbi:MAG: LamG domain-containing protein, partial [Patescibacteria group bacterium]
ENTLSINQVGKWSFEESSSPFKDTSGYGNNGLCSGVSCPVSQTASTCGLGFGGCLKFNGLDTFVTVAHHSSLNPTNAVTLVAWVKRMGNGGPPDANRGILLSKSSNYLDARTTDFCMSLIINGDHKYKCAGVVSNGKWYHVVGTYDGTTFKIYIDGKEVFREGYLGTITTLNDSLFIGSYNGVVGNGYFFNGFLDEPAIYNQAFTLSQIQQLYAQGLPRHQLARQ